MKFNELQMDNKNGVFTVFSQIWVKLRNLIIPSSSSLQETWVLYRSSFQPPKFLPEEKNCTSKPPVLLPRVKVKVTKWKNLRDSRRLARWSLDSVASRMRCLSLSAVSLAALWFGDSWASLKRCRSRRASRREDLCSVDSDASRSCCWILCDSSLAARLSGDSLARRRRCCRRLASRRTAAGSWTPATPPTAPSPLLLSAETDGGGG